MSVTITNRNFKNKGKDIKYLNKDFASFRNNLIEFAKTIFQKLILILMNHLLV
jgi:hypothetical protein